MSCHTANTRELGHTVVTVTDLRLALRAGSCSASLKRSGPLASEDMAILQPCGHSVNVRKRPTYLRPLIVTRSFGFLSSQSTQSIPRQSRYIPGPAATAATAQACQSCRPEHVLVNPRTFHCHNRLSSTTEPQHAKACEYRFIQPRLTRTMKCSGDELYTTFGWVRRCKA